MLSSIDLYCQFSSGTIEIQNIMVDNELSAERNRICAQELIPQLLFLLCHVIPKIPGTL